MSSSYSDSTTPRQQDTLIYKQRGNLQRHSWTANVTFRVYHCSFCHWKYVYSGAETFLTRMVLVSDSAFRVGDSVNEVPGKFEVNLDDIPTYETPCATSIGNISGSQQYLRAY